MNWAQRRKLTYVLLVLAFFGIVGYAIYHKVADVTPTCFDGKRNGDEAGIDCGGGCSMYCPNQLTDPAVQWVRVFPISSGMVTAVAYIQHNAPGASAKNVGYEFKLYDDQNNLLADRKGTTFLGTAGTSAIAETLIPVGTASVALARFTFDDPIGWEKIGPIFSQVVIATDRNAIEKFDGGTRLTATLQNKSRISFSDVDVVAIFYDKDGNAITASKALLPSLPALKSSTLFFTWPYDVKNVARTEIIPRLNPYTSEY